MLGAVKGDAQSQVSLFRLLSRRWRPVVPLKRSAAALPSVAAEGETRPASKWIGAPRVSYAPTLLPKPPGVAKTRSTWSPWQFVK